MDAGIFTTLPSCLLWANAVIAFALAVAPLTAAAGPPDYSKEAIVIQQVTTKVAFTADGKRRWQQTMTARIQSTSAVQQFGVLSFSYSAGSEQVEIQYLRVRKPDGSVIETPPATAMDVATEVARIAPTYSDVREKQIPVKSLGVGDVLEYSIISSVNRPEVPGHFWYEQAFIDDAVVLDQTIEIRVPKSKYVQVSSPKLTSVVHEEGDERVYVWSHSHLEPSKPAEKKAASADDEPPKVRLTTFRSWEEVGSWWGTLAAEQEKVTPAVQAKANELTAGMTTDLEKARALYSYVALKFRYISISFGAGRYRPHSAEEVLANQYGDCKDKHTLLAALLKAAGIPAWPALIGAGIKFDASVPSPAEFNHVITVLPQNGQYIWLDTTTEVAPFGYLMQVIRDQEALVIPSTGIPFLQKTPVDPPAPSSETLDVKASLTADGTLTGHFSFSLLGDGAVVMRAALRLFAPAQWPTFAQQVSTAWGYPGDVTAVDIENLEDVEKPLRFSYDYKGTNFSDWQNHRIMPPMPPLGFGAAEGAEKPKDPVWAGAVGQLTYRTSIQVPKGFSVELPPSTEVTGKLADYTSHYALNDGTLVAERKLVIKKAKVTPDEWSEYVKFGKDLRKDQAQFISFFDRPSIEKGPSNNNPEALDLIKRAFSSIQTHDFSTARDLLKQAERINPKQSGLWAGYGYIEQSSGNRDNAIADYRKELEDSPYEPLAYLELANLLVQTGQEDKALDLLRTGVSKLPDNAMLALRLGNMLADAKRYAEILPILEKPIASAPQDYRLQELRVRALLGLGRQDEAAADAVKIAKATSDAMVLNDVAYYLADAAVNLTVAQELAGKATVSIEQDCSKASLGHFDNSDLERVNDLAAVWDTLGWIDFRRGDLSEAAKYVNAAWELAERADIADHLGEIYDKQSRRAGAVHMWRLALAANPRDRTAKERLQKSGAPLVEPRHLRGKSTNDVSSPDEELGKLRTLGVPALPKQTGSAEFFLLMSQRGIEDVQFINGIDALKGATNAIQSVRYEFPFPDSGPEKIIRRGILSCSQYTTPSCQLTLLLPAAVRKTAD